MFVFVCLVKTDFAGGGQPGGTMFEEQKQEEVSSLTNGNRGHKLCEAAA